MPIRAAWLAFLVAAAGLGGCSLPELGLGAWGAAPSTAPVVVTTTDDPPAGTAPPAADVAWDGRRMLRVSLGTGPPRTAELLQEQRERRLWRSGDSFAFATDGPRVTATAGQPQVIMATRIDGPDPLATPEALLAEEATARRLVDLATPSRDPAQMRFGLEISCRLRAAPAEEPGLLVVTERCRGPRGIGDFTNRFWLRRGDGAVLRSEQWIGPGLPPLVLDAAGS